MIYTLYIERQTFRKSSTVFEQEKERVLIHGPLNLHLSDNGIVRISV